MILDAFTIVGALVAIALVVATAIASGCCKKS
jgi:hypothetical protein